MIRLIYISSATHDLSEQELIDLLAQCRDRNRRMNVTGMLLYRDGAFLQVLEGEAKDVDDIYRSVLGDGRNTGHYLVAREPIEQRNFADWSMGFKDLSSLSAEELEGYSDIFDTGNLPENVADIRDRAIALLLKF